MLTFPRISISTGAAIFDFNGTEFFNVLARSTGCFFKLAPLKLFGIFSLRLGVFFREILQICWQFIFTSTNFCKFILIFHQMVLIFPRVPIVFTLSRK